MCSSWAPGLRKPSQSLKPVNWISSFRVTAVICYTLSHCFWASGSWKMFQHIKARETLRHRQRYICKRVALTRFLFHSNKNAQPLLCCQVCLWKIDSALSYYFLSSYLLLNFYIKVWFCVLFCWFYKLFPLFFFSIGEMNTTHRWFLKHFCSPTLTCKSIWICKCLRSYWKKKLVFLLQLWVYEKVKTLKTEPQWLFVI